MHLLNWGQWRTFENAAGVIFLSQTSRRVYENARGTVEGCTAIIPHGISTAFDQEPTTAHPIDDFRRGNPFRWLYVSPIRLYKHQWHVVQAVEALRKEGFPIALDLVGSPNPRAIEKLRDTLREVDPDEEYVRYHGRVPYREVNDLYQRSDAFVFASTCEAFGQVLTEAMQAGLPIACSNQSAAPEVVQDAGVYFDPEQPDEIAEAMRMLMEDELLRSEKARTGYQRAQDFSWDRCARETFSFITKVARSSDR